MRYFSIVLLLIGSLFIGCGDTDVDVKSSTVTATTSNGTDYNFNGRIIIEWDSYGTTLTDRDRIEVKNMRVEVDGVIYPSSWEYSSRIEDLKDSDIADKETKVNYSFNIQVPSSTSDRACKLRYRVSLDGDTTDQSINCVLHARR